MLWLLFLLLPPGNSSWLTPANLRHRPYVPLSSGPGFPGPWHAHTSVAVPPLDPVVLHVHVCPGKKIIARSPDSLMGCEHRDGRRSWREQVQRGWGSSRLPKGQIGLTVAVAGRPGDLLTPFSGCWLAGSWCVMTEEEEPGPRGELGSRLRPERDSAFLCLFLPSTHSSQGLAVCRLWVLGTQRRRSHRFLPHGLKEEWAGSAGALEGHVL